MIKLAQHLLQPWGRILGGFSISANEISRGINQINLSSRVSRIAAMQVSLYVVGGVLIDAGFLHAREPLLRVLSPVKLRAICLTHHHEDHSGICGTLAQLSGCPIYLRNIDRRFDEGVVRFKPYRLFWWGVPERYEPLEMPECIETNDRTLSTVPIPGHSATHTAFFDEQSGNIFVGDLVMNKGVSAVMSHENPFESIVSLRRVADLSPVRMLTGHGLVIDHPVPFLREKADTIEQAAFEVVRLHHSGLSERAIVAQVFPYGRARDLLMEVVTSGQFSRLNFVRACIRFSEK
jgi:glyoxylase-like metal-dependent hydrolase (beta-lactamase superfamily II)